MDIMPPAFVLLLHDELCKLKTSLQDLGLTTHHHTNHGIHSQWWLVTFEDKRERIKMMPWVSLQRRVEQKV